MRFAEALGEHSELTEAVDVDLEDTDSRHYLLLSNESEERILEGPSRTKIVLRILNATSGDILYWESITMAVIDGD